MLSRFLVCLCVSGWLGSLLAQSPFAFNFDDTQSVWRLSNGVIEAEYRLTPAGQFACTRLTDLETRRVVTAPVGQPSSPIDVSVDGVPYNFATPFTLVSQSARAIARQGYRQTILLEDRSRRARFEIRIDLHQGHKVVRHMVVYRSLVPAPTRLERARFLSWNFANEAGPVRVFRVNQYDARRGFNFEPLESVPSRAGAALLQAGSGAQFCTWVATRDTRNRGFFFGWEFNGRSTVQVTQTFPTNPVQVTGEIAEFSAPVVGRGTFTLPAAFMGLFEGDWDDAGHASQEFALAAIARPMTDRRFPYLMWDSWGYETNIDEATLRRAAQIAASIGVEVFIVDLGWAKEMGDWTPDPKKFPSGLKAFSDYVKSLGMKFGLHYAFPEATRTSPMLRNNPDWTATVNEWYFGATSLCLGHQPVRDHLLAEAIRMIDEYGVDWMLQDGENMVKRCTKTTHTHDPGNGNHANAMGLDYIVTEAQRLRPNTMWENCEDGGNMMTYAMLRNYVTSIAADNSGEISTRKGTYGATYPFPLRYTDRYMPIEGLTKYMTRSYMFGGPWIIMSQLPRMADWDLAVLANEARLYKQIRLQVTRGRVYHLTPPPAEGRIDALESLDEATGVAYLFAWRANAPENFIVLRPRGLNPDREYTVRYQDFAGALRMTGRQLMTDGVRVPLPDKYAAEIVYLRPLPANAN